MSPPSPDSLVVDAVVRWARGLLRPGSPPRVNVRPVFGTNALAEAVRSALEPLSGPDAWYIVRSSAHEDAVRLRHDRPSNPPQGVGERTPLLYILFWVPSEPGHEKNAQSLQELRPVDVAEVLADENKGGAGVLDAERAIERRCEEAAEAWKGKDRLGIAEQLKRAWQVLCQTLRQGRGGRERSVSFVQSLEQYAAWLRRASPPEPLWSRLEPSARAGRLVVTWGEALPELSLFRIPELASLLGIIVEPDHPPARKTTRDSWPTTLARILAENLDVAMDFASLADKIAGKSDLEQRLTKLTSKIPLAREDPQAAHSALLQFCHTGDHAAFEKVDWLFHQEPSNRRSSSLGLKGVLIARGSRQPRVLPEERAAEELQRLLELVAGADGSREVLSRFVETLKQEAMTQPRGAFLAAQKIRELGTAQVPAGILDPEFNAILGQMVKSPRLESSAFERVAVLWGRLEREQEDMEIEAPHVLLGLARLCARWLVQLKGTEERIRIEGRQLHLSCEQLPREPLVLPMTGWGAASRDKISAWLRDKVLARLKDELSEQEGAEPETEGLSAPDVELLINARLEAAGEQPELTGRIRLVWPTELPPLVESTGLLASWNLESDDARSFSSLPQMARLFQRPHQSAVAVPEELDAAWQRYVKVLGTRAGWALAFILGPLPRDVQGWVNAWANAFAWTEKGLGGGHVRRLLEIEALFKRAIDERRFEALAPLQAEKDRLQALPQPPAPPALTAVRALLRACTGAWMSSGQPTHIVLLPHHPLVLRLRWLSEEVLLDVLRTLGGEGWPVGALEDLEKQLEDWGLPEPMHFYGWSDRDPLVFDGWLKQTGLAVFSGLGAGREVDIAQLGTTEVLRSLERYLRLFPASGDRLQLRLRADPKGNWASRLIELFLRRLPHASADMDILVPETASGTLAFEQHEGRGEERRRAFEMQDDGTAPRLRARREPEGEACPAHMALVVGDAMDAFLPEIGQHQAPDVELKTWDRGVLFARSHPDVRTYAFVVRDPPDELCLRAARAISYARNQELQVHVERYSFDPDRVAVPLRELHEGVHWLVLASRQPLHRAVQAAGQNVASLLDFHTTSERGRPVHVCVSIGTHAFSQDLKRLDAMLQKLLGEQIEGLAGAMVSHARRFAPGLAITCASASSTAFLEGLLGLLLTQQKMKSREGNVLVLAMDQHQSLLSRSGDGQRGDVLALREHAKGLQLEVGESKLTIQAVGPQDSVVIKACKQVRNTCERLRRLSSDHPLAPAVRAELSHAIVDRLHLSGLGEGIDADGATSLLRLASAADTRVSVMDGQSAVYLWSLESGTQDQQVFSAEGIPVVIHGRQATLQGLRELVGTSTLS